MKQVSMMFDAVSIFFIIMSIVVCISTAALLSGRVDAPGALAPKTAIPIPTFIPSETPEFDVEPETMVEEATSEAETTAEVVDDTVEEETTNE